MTESDQTAAHPPELSKTQRETLDTVLDLLIPPSEDGRMPGASDYDLWAYICGSASEVATAVRADLDRLERFARDAQDQSLASLAADDARAMVEEIQATEPEFLTELVRQTISCYYQQDRVLEAIGMEARAPFPKGYVVEAGDFSLLDPVRRRAKIYREI